MSVAGLSENIWSSSLASRFSIRIHLNRSVTFARRSGRLYHLLTLASRPSRAYDCEKEKPQRDLPIVALIVIIVETRNDRAFSRGSSFKMSDLACSNSSLA